MTDPASPPDPSGPTGRTPVTGAMHIGEVATRTELSLRSLRHWEEVGLLHPSGRTDGGFRLYTEDDVQKILVIRRMKPLGFSLDQMKAVMSDIEVVGDARTAPADRSAASQRLEAIRVETVDRRARLVRQVEMADEFLDLIVARLD